MNVLPRTVLTIAGLVMAAQAAAQVTLYEHDGFQGRAVTTDPQVMNLERFGFNDRASSAMVAGKRYERWEVCEDRRFRGRCVVLRPGRCVSLAAMGLNGRISSVRAVDPSARVHQPRCAPMPMVARDWGRRNNESLFEAHLTSVHAVLGDAGLRRWVEREQVV